MSEPPDGYRWIDGGPAIALVDPERCPGGHRFAFGQRGHAPCAQHHGHPQWICACGVVLYGHHGEFVTELPCR
jgi:hypothetical protein